MKTGPILAALAGAVMLASAAQAQETRPTPATDPNPDETRLSVVLDASGALSLQLEGPEYPPPGPWRTSRGHLAADIRKRLPLAESPHVHFRGSPDASYEAVIDVFKRLSGAGYRPRVIIEGRQ